jgi:hypothetical protein
MESEQANSCSKTSNNGDRFMFQLSREKFTHLKSQIVISNWDGAGPLWSDLAGVYNCATSGCTNFLRHPDGFEGSLPTVEEIEAELTGEEKRE